MKSFYVTPGDYRLHYHDLPGEAPAILFIHGLGCASSFDYPRVAASSNLAGHRRILVDLLGSGYSDKPEDFPYAIDDHAGYLEKLLTSEGFSGIYLYGHSMGGAVAIALARRCPERVAGLVLSESNLDPGGGFASRKIRSFGLEKYMELGHQGMISLARRRKDDIYWAYSMEASSPMAVFREAESLVAGTDPSWRDILYSLDIPSTFIFGEKSLPDRDSGVLEDRGINIEIVEDAGHGMAWENPEGLARAIRRGIEFSE